MLTILIEALKDEDWNVRMYAAYALGKIGPGAKEAVPALKKAQLEDQNVQIRDVAAVALEKIEQASTETP